MKLLDRDRISKIAAGTGGIPVKKFEPDPDRGWVPSSQWNGPSLIEEFAAHHKEETEVLYQMLREACVMLERQQAVITAVGFWSADKDELAYNPDAVLENAMAKYWAAEAEDR